MRPIPEDKMYSSKTSPTTLSGHKQRVRAVDPKEQDREKRRQIQSNFFSNPANRYVSDFQKIRATEMKHAIPC